MSKRKADFPIHPHILNRWSPRAMSGEAMDDKELFSLFEAARWAPSSYNNQPWYFIYAKRNTPAWDKLFKLLVEFNQSWAKNAAALIVIISKDTFHKTGKPSHTSRFDTGAAWENLALEGAVKNLVVHGMEGFDYKKAREVLNIPEGYTIEAMAAIGKPGKKEDLPAELQEREEPSDRRPISEFVFEGSFKKKE